MLQIRPGTIIFSDVSLMLTVHYKDNSHKLYLKFHLKLFVHTNNNFDSKTYFMSIYSAKEYVVFMKRLYAFIRLGRPLLDILIFYSKSCRSPCCYRAPKLRKLDFFHIPEECIWRKTSCSGCGAEECQGKRQLWEHC